MKTPLPIAGLLRRARNAKSPKEQHDTAYFAWEASVRLAVAARPPADCSRLAMPSVGQWVDGFPPSSAVLDAPAILAVYSLLSEEGLGSRSTPSSITPAKLLSALPAYRNHVMGHGSVRPLEFYQRAALELLDGLTACWTAGVFWPADSTLVFIDTVELDQAGASRARVVTLDGDVASVEDSRGSIVPKDVRPNRLYLRRAGDYRPLHPWLLYRESELREQVLFFNGRGRASQYLDYLSGESLRGKALAEARPGIEDDVLAMLSRPPEPPSAEPERADPEAFGDYRILGKLGEGGMGIVYLARQESLGRLVALKMLPEAAADDPVAIARFRREISALSRCDHPNVVKILASGQAQGRHYYAMEFVEGADLAQVAGVLPSAATFDAAVSSAAERARAAKAAVFANVPNVTRREAPSLGSASGDRTAKLAQLFRDAARALQHVHDQGVIHRDIKPANLMVTAGDHRLVLMDLGLAAVADATKSITRDKNSLLGTLRYMPPEQLQRSVLELDGRADVYALGATFYELLVGKRIHDGDSEVRVLEQILNETPVAAHVANPRLGGELSAILSHATEKDRSRRYATAAELASDLDAYLEGKRPPVAMSGARPRRKLMLVLGAALAGVALAVGIAAFTVRAPRTEPGASGAVRPDDGRWDCTGVVVPPTGYVVEVGVADAARPNATQEAIDLARQALTKRVCAARPCPELSAAMSTWRLGEGQGKVCVQVAIEQRVVERWSGAAPPADSVALGRVAVTSSPPNALVTLEGGADGSFTPAILDKLPVGKPVQVRLSLAGYQEAIRTVTAKQGSLETVHVALEPLGGRKPVQPRAANPGGATPEPAKPSKPRDLTKELLPEPER